MAALGPDIRVLVTGSSHVFASVNPAHVRYPTMNLAAPVCSYVCVEGIVLGNLPRVPQLEVLVLEYDIVPLLYDSLEAYHGDYRQLLELEPDISAMHVDAWRKYELWRDRLVQESFFAPLFRFGKLTPEEMLNRLRGERATEDPVIGPGFSNGPEVMPEDDDGPARVARHQRESPGLTKLAENEAALLRILSLARQRGLTVALMRFPHHPGYWQAQPDAWRRVHEEVLGRVHEQYPEVPFWDFGLVPGFVDADYRNGDHINEGATARLSALFEAKLESVLEPPP
jgi:hypothetical protein